MEFGRQQVVDIQVRQLLTEVPAEQLLVPTASDVAHGIERREQASSVALASQDVMHILARIEVVGRWAWAGDTLPFDKLRTGLPYEKRCESRARMWARDCCWP